MVIFARGRFTRFFMTDSERTTTTSRYHPYSNFISAMHGFQDNEVLLLTVYDVIVSPPPGGVSHNFC